MDIVVGKATTWSVHMLGAVVTCEHWPFAKCYIEYRSDEPCLVKGFGLLKLPLPTGHVFPDVQLRLTDIL